MSKYMLLFLGNKGRHHIFFFLVFLTPMLNLETTNIISFPLKMSVYYLSRKKRINEGERLKKDALIVEKRKIDRCSLLSDFILMP